MQPLLHPKSTPSQLFSTDPLPPTRPITELSAPARSARCRRLSSRGTLSTTRATHPGAHRSCTFHIPGLRVCSSLIVSAPLSILCCYWCGIYHIGIPLFLWASIPV
ncbi:hypothetical protein Mapa_008934 [Marchantia paleacea]|nr:hypothetical protein Mapa_008934 [Marchantia paleacea]